MTTTPFEPDDDHDQRAAGVGGEDEEPDEVPERAVEEGEPGEPPD